MKFAVYKGDEQLTKGFHYVSELLQEAIRLDYVREPTWNLQLKEGYEIKKVVENL